MHTAQLFADADAVVRSFEKDGFCVIPEVAPEPVVRRARARFRPLMRGEYETGVTPNYPKLPPQVVTDEPAELYRLYQPHVADRAIRELMTQPALGEWAARLTGAKRVQLFGTLLLYKPTDVVVKGNIGWHQDQHYFTTVWTPESEVFFASVAVSDVGPESGPVIMVRGSHQWGYRAEGDFYQQDLAAARSGIHMPAGATWEEVHTVMPAGAVSFHHKNTFHASQANRSQQPRLSVLAFLRTERSTPLPGSDSFWIQHLDDQQMCPVIYEA